MERLFLIYSRLKEKHIKADRKKIYENKEIMAKFNRKHDEAYWKDKNQGISLVLQESVQIHVGVFNYKSHLFCKVVGGAI